MRDRGWGERSNSRIRFRWTTSPKRKRPRPETVAKRALKAGLPVKSYTTADGTTINLGEPDSSAAVTSNPWDAATEALTKK